MFIIETQMYFYDFLEFIWALPLNALNIKTSLLEGCRHLWSHVQCKVKL